jgi:hypothetical protein
MIQYYYYYYIYFISFLLLFVQALEQCDNGCVRLPTFWKTIINTKNETSDPNLGQDINGTTIRANLGSRGEATILNTSTWKILIETKICDKYIKDIITNIDYLTNDFYYAPDVIIEYISAQLNIQILNSCLTNKSQNALTNIFKEINMAATTTTTTTTATSKATKTKTTQTRRTEPSTAHLTIYTSIGCSKGFEMYRHELNGNSQPKALGRTLYQYNHGQNYGPRLC